MQRDENTEKSNNYFCELHHKQLTHRVNNYSKPSSEPETGTNIQNFFSKSLNQNHKTHKS